MRSQFSDLTTRAAILGSGITIGATIFAMRFAAKPADGGALLDLCGTLAVVWGTKFAADNLEHLRSVEEARQQPLVIPEWPLGLPGMQQAYELKLRNHGEVVALNVEGEVLRRLPGEEPRPLQRLRLPTSTFTPKELYATNFNRVKIDLQFGSVIVRLRYTSPSGEQISADWETPYEDAEFMPSRQMRNN